MQSKPLQPVQLVPLIFVLLFLSCSTQTVEWPEPTQSSKPWTRWWWMGNAVDRQNISRELSEFAEMGIGGVEITPIYGVKGEEERFVEFLSPGFSDVINYTIDEADKLGLGVDLPPGSGWRCGGPFVPHEKGLWNLKIRKFDVKASEEMVLNERFENMAAASFLTVNGEVLIINGSDAFVPKADGTIYVALREKSNNDVKRPAKGGEGWAIDTFDEEITNWYLGEFWNRLGIDEGKLRCFFHDSFEYTGDFTPGFLEEFKARRGYNLTKYLHVLAGDCQSKETVTRVKSDYRQTLSDLVLESFIKPMTDWANNHKSLNRNQAHGSPGNILDLYAACDIPETEIFQRLNQGSPDVFVNKFASSAAHVTGQKLVSSESYTWLEEHWTVTTSDLVKATNRFFLAGINHMFFHGTCYSPEDAPWPGWLFYASTQMNNRNPFWREMPALFKYIERTQTVLQKSNSQSDILIYWPYFDVAASEGRIFNHLGVNKDAGWFNSHPISELSESLTNSGYTFDYISDKQLDDCQLLNNEIITSGDAVYKAIVIPQSEYIPVKTMQKLSEFIQSGGKVIFDKNLPKSVPGMHNLEERIQLMEQLKTGMPQNNVGDVGEKLVELQVEGEKDLADKGFHYLKMRLDGEIFYLIFNTTSEKIDEWVKINHPSKSFIFMNPMNGLISKAGSKGKKVRIQLNPEEIVFIKCLDKNVNVKPHIYFEENLTQQEIKGHWKVVFEEGGPVYPGNIDIKELKSWTEAGDAETQRFAGTTRYTINFEWDGSNSGFLNLGDVRDCAHVYVNDKDFGTLPGPTFSVYVDNLKKGSNKLEIEVTNVAANRIRDLDKRGVVWRKFYDINFVNIDYKPFDASGWVVREAGLLGPVTLLSHPE